MGEAVGILEVFGLVCAFMAADAGCKAGNVRLEPFDKNKPANADSLPVPLLVTIKFRGSISDVEAAMEAGEAQAKAYYNQVVPAMDRLRDPADKLEMIVDKELWPFPSYGDLIFEV